ncbi:class I SAM-dependent methyltransferase [uncultured Chloroflexus sp.]|uniref:class I SAM-dependent methyltransferase n=1 Tax=uncultured Chloroflexus sp. TaxID=214040 RepID=UPI002603A649|nr:class I SAM-dependent methyltransferase [uncultured Chloroflexus sp.]
MSEDLSHLSREAQALWEQNAAFWDDYMGEGGSFQRELIGPLTERLLDLRAGERVLDIACGNGAFSRHMASLGVDVVACDFSATFLERAQARTTTGAARIVYRQIDATQLEQLLALGERRFDAAVCTMALMDMATLDPLFVALSRMLKPGGRFVFSVMHPCFNTVGTRKMLVEEDRDGEILVTRAVIQTHYSTPQISKGLGIIGQPAPQYYFHRPLNALLKPAFHVGFVLDALEEPVFQRSEEARRPLSWDHFTEIPPVLIARLRLITGLSGETGSARSPVFRRAKTRRPARRRCNASARLSLHCSRCAFERAIG